MTRANLIPADLLDQWFPASDAALHDLRAQVQYVKVPAGQVLFRRGDTCNQYMVVVSGCVRVQVLSSGGREVLLYRVHDGESCVVTTSCLISNDTYPAEGIAEQETAAVVIARDMFREGLARSEDFRRFVFSAQGQRLSELIQRVEDVAFGRIDEKLARLLIDRCRNRPGAVNATHQQLASELGSAREVISRQLKVFERNGWIALHRGGLDILRPDALGSLCSSNTGVSVT